MADDGCACFLVKVRLEPHEVIQEIPVENKRNRALRGISAFLCTLRFSIQHGSSRGHLPLASLIRLFNPQNAFVH